jgi:hypothetical protein
MYVNFESVATPLWRSVKMTLTLPKWGLGSPLGLPKIQSSIARVKTPFLEVFFISLESSWSVDVENGLVEPFRHPEHKLWMKEGSGVKLPVWLPTTKRSGIDPTPMCALECNTLLESSWGDLQVCFRPHPNWRSKQGVMNSQSAGNPNRDNFRNPPWESREKMPFKCRCRRVT